MRRKVAEKQFDVPHKFRVYGTWDYLSKLPIYSQEYYDLFVSVRGRDFALSKNIRADTKVRMYYNYIKYETDEFKELSIEFDKWIGQNEWIKDYHQFCLKSVTYVEDPFEIEHRWFNVKTRNTQDEAKVEKIKKWLNEPIDYRRFLIVSNSEMKLLEYNEIKREIPYVIGNVVALRTKCLGSKNHDPFYNKVKEIRDQERIGYITALLDETHSNSFNGKGSRLVEVHWLATGERHQQAISSIKLIDQKNNKFANKLIEE